MGIPLYFKKISHEFVDIVSQTKPTETVSRLFLDFNCAIHYCCNELKNDTVSYGSDEFEEKLIQACKDYILKLRDVVKPTELIYVSIDGVVPMAKISQQRKRRFFSDLKNKGKTEWNSNGITPGTLFMKNLIYELNEFKRIVDFEIIIDAERGEGEHKICHFIRQNDIPSGLDIIYGLDADMILLSMLSKHSEKTYLLREHVKNNKILVYMSIQNTKLQIYKQFANIINDKASSVNFLIECYTFITFLVGNDFLPNLSYISLRSNGITTLLEGYKEVYNKLNEHILLSTSTCTSSTHSNQKISLNYDFFKEYMITLSEKEDVCFKEQEENYYNTNQSYRNQDMECYPIKHKYPRIINSHKPGWRQNYYYYLFEKSTDTSIISIACKQYVQGLQWMILYYFNQETEWYWFYRYNYSPTIMDLSNYVLSTELIDLYVMQLKNDKHEIQDYDQLVMVLPPSSMYIIPNEEHRKIVYDVSYGHTHLYPETFEICTYMKYRLHECGSQGLFLSNPLNVEGILEIH